MLRQDFFEETGKVSGSSSGGGDSVFKTIKQVAHGFSVKTVVYVNSSGVWAKGGGTSTTTLNKCDGIVSAVISADVFTVVLHGWIKKLTGITAGTLYYISPTTAGLLSSTAPSIGQLSHAVAVGLDTTTLYMFPQNPYITTVRAGDSTNGGGGIRIYTDSSTGAYIDLDPTTGTFKMNFSSGNNTITFAAADFVAVSNDVRMRELDICDGTGVAKKILVLASAPY